MGLTDTDRAFLDYLDGMDIETLTADEHMVVRRLRSKGVKILNVNGRAKVDWTTVD